MLRDDVVLALQDLLESRGWTVLKDAMEKRREMAAAALASESSTADLAAVRSLQAKITELDFLLMWPKQEVRRLQATNR